MLNLENIIKEAPEDFDIIQIGTVVDKSKTNNTNLYEKYNRSWGAHAYIITKTGVNKLMKFAYYNQETTKFNIDIPLNVSELFIFGNLNTYTYKYNIINTLNDDSFIHNDHLLYHKKCSLISLYDILLNLHDI